ncbi:MAG: SDR family oxidoreductase [Proteobacteria bacterium]|nr:SDR family oxidoreductase [Pseudomonadota bacterium]
MPSALILGASRGLGLEFVRQYRSDGWEVFGSARDAAGLATLTALGARALQLDVLGADAPHALDAALRGTALDVAIVNAGIYGPRTQALEPPSQVDFDVVMHTNVLAAMHLVPRLAAALERGHGRLAVISSRMGSIGERNGTAGWLYRASKAALNSVLKDASLVLGPRGVTCVALHPGWVKTDMGGQSADIDALTSVRGMRTKLAALEPAEQGGFFSYDGTPIAW